jgi:2-polyprenyl-6-methoxyphenol hydroxylase-like FAD-dependent oxidoreductase
MKITVIGAGIAGLVAASGLQRDGHDVTVHERRTDITPDGAGLTLFQNAFEALDLVDLGDSIRGISSDAIASMRSGQRAPSGDWLLSVPTGSAPPLRSIHRADLHSTLLGHLRPGTVHTGSTATVSVDGLSPIRTNTDPEATDLVIVADGIHSRNRTALGLDTGLRYAGCTAWRGLTTDPVDIHNEAGETWGRGQLFGIVPLPDERVYWFATCNTPADSTFPNERAAVQQLFGEWHAPIPDLIKATAPDHLIRHDIYDLATPLPSFTRGRTVLIGDAAHGMTPNLGQGAGQGIEDAATLAVLLRGTSPDQLDGVLEKYTELRHHRTTSVMKRSRLVGRVAQLSNPALVHVRNAALRLTPGATMAKTTDGITQWPQP